MKKKIKRIMKSCIITSLLLICIVGCGKNSNSNSDSNNNFIAFEKSPLLDQYETKTLDEGITYKELSYKDEDDLYVTLVVYNDTDNYVYVESRAYGYLNGQRTKQVSQVGYESISPRTAAPISFYLINADSYKLDKVTMKVQSNVEKALPRNAYKYVGYDIKSTTYPELNLYFEYQSTGKHLAEVHILGFKDGEYVYHTTEFMNLMDENKKEVFDDILKKGDDGFARFQSYNSIYNVDEMDSFIYFISGFYDD